MAAPSYTYSLVNGATADASQIMQNYNDILNGVTDGTKDLTISALTCNGAANFKGAVTLGDASADDITFTGSLASSIPIKTTNAVDIGSATLGLRAAYFGANSQTAKIVGNAAMAGALTITLPLTTCTLVGKDTTDVLTNKTSIGIGDGTAAAPSMNFTSDSDGSGTGIYRVGANIIGFSTNGVARGNVGATGVWTLGVSASVAQHVFYSDVLVDSGVNGTAATVTVNDPAGRTTVVKSPSGTVNAQIGTTTGHNLDIISNNTVAATVSTGQVWTQTSQPSVHAYATGSQTIVNATADGGALVTFGTELFDIGGNFASDTFTAPVAGHYMIMATVSWIYSANATTLDLVTFNVFKNGSAYTSIVRSERVKDLNSYQTATVQAIVALAAADTMAIRMDSAVGGGATRTLAAAQRYISIHKVS